MVEMVCLPMFFTKLGRDRACKKVVGPGCAKKNGHRLEGDGIPCRQYELEIVNTDNKGNRAHEIVIGSCISMSMWESFPARSIALVFFEPVLAHEGSL